MDIQKKHVCLPILCLLSLSAFRISIINIVEADMFIYNFSLPLPYRSLMSVVMLKLLQYLCICLSNNFSKTFLNWKLPAFGIWFCRMFACKCTHISRGSLYSDTTYNKQELIKQQCQQTRSGCVNIDVLWPANLMSHTITSVLTKPVVLEGSIWTAA